MRRTAMISAGAALAMVVAIAGGAAAVAAHGDDDGPAITGRDADLAVAAALAATGGGRANSVELDSEDGAVWEVEVTRPDGATVDVRLDEALGVVVIEADREAPDAGS